MQCFNGKLIKEEQLHQHYSVSTVATDVRTVVIGEPQKIILSPRVEIHRVLKSAPDEMDEPPQVIFTTVSNSPRSHGHHQDMHHMTHHQHQESPSPPPLAPPLLQQQRVQVIKDGRFYEEPTTVVRSFGGHQKDNSASLYQSSPPPLLHHQQQQQQQQSHHQMQHPQQQHQQHVHLSAETKKVSVGRQINVISNIGERDLDGGTTTVTVVPMNGINDGSVAVFRPPVVSSTSTPMRPPPPPPPPRIKGSSPEEPSSSIPDLGEFPLSVRFFG